MIRRFIGIAVVAASVALPFAAQAQGVPGGVERGSREGERAAGPVGAIVGGVIGGVVGGVNGVLGVDERPRFRSYVVEQRRPSCRKKASPTTTSRKNMGFATTATRWSTAARFWSSRAAEGSSKSSSKTTA